MSETIAEITYSKPQVYLLQESGLGTSEFAGRTAYSSFNKSENDIIKILNDEINDGSIYNSYASEVWNRLNNIEHSDLLDQLAHVYHHDSVLEHCNLTFLVKDTSRGVLQEHARHRIQSITVQSTRYTMSSVINAFIAAKTLGQFRKLIKSLDMFVLSDIAEDIEIRHLYEKLDMQFYEMDIDSFLDISTSKDNTEYVNSDKFREDSFEVKFKTLQSNKQKRNIGDNFKWAVTDNWKVDLVFTMNLRSLKNYLKLRDSGAAYFQIRWLAEEIIKATPQKYLDLIDKKYKEDS